MTDSQHHDLRARIAAVLYERSVRRAGLDLRWATLTQDVVKQFWLDDADAVIAAVGLERQAHYDPDCDYYRYVTDWIAP